MFLSSAGPLSTDGIGMITLSPLERTVNFVFVFFVKESACTCWPDRALFRARLMSIFAISDKLSLESTGGISLPAIPASLTQLN
jgi:hypothetical protein